MSFYNAIMGFNPACVLIMPMLGRREHEYPRFRDCFLVDGMIAIYTRVGGGNRNVPADGTGIAANAPKAP